MNTSPKIHLPGVLEALSRLAIKYRIVDAQSAEERSLIEWTELAFPFVHSQIDWARIPKHRCIEWNDLEDLVPRFRKLSSDFDASGSVVVMWANGLCPSVEMALGDVVRIARDLVGRVCVQSARGLVDRDES